MSRTAENIATEIRTAYDTYTTQHGEGTWMSIVTLAERVDLTPEQIAAGVKHLNRTDRAFATAGKPDQWSLTDMDRTYAVTIGGQANHVITWG
ncbi:hypothetical protein ACLQ25_09425 [Micromonospora sp. DT44]|uniref:hypothetical protein n=1 Tax=Micromonospora sp. DT44 TaxID=3393439 RepID=UPI003CF02606